MKKLLKLVLFLFIFISLCPTSESIAAGAIDIKDSNWRLYRAARVRLSDRRSEIIVKEGINTVHLSLRGAAIDILWLSADEYFVSAFQYSVTKQAVRSWMSSWKILDAESQFPVSSPGKGSVLSEYMLKELTRILEEGREELPGKSTGM